MQWPSLFNPRRLRSCGKRGPCPASHSLRRLDDELLHHVRGLYFSMSTRALLAALFTRILQRPTTCMGRSQQGFHEHCDAGGQRVDEGALADAGRRSDRELLCDSACIVGRQLAVQRARPASLTTRW